MFKKLKNIHFIGIGGAGMSGIAEVLLNLGYRVTGSDAAESETTRRLTALGARVRIGHEALQVEGAHVVVVSSAIRSDNPEVLLARARNIPVVPRAEMLCEIARLKYTVAVAGTHGKTTTTSMVGSVLLAGGLDPTLIVGGRLKATQSGARLGQGEYLVAEADESDGSFLKLAPAVAVITNIDNDHLDYYGTMEKLEVAFVEFANRVPFYGTSILCLDDPRCREMVPRLKRRFVSYGFDPKADTAARRLTVSAQATSFEITQGGKALGRVELSVPGRHNVQNALAAVCVGLELEVPFARIAQALAEFQGVGRRLEVRGEEAGILVVDDYGHHPTEIRCTLSAIRERWPGRRLIVIFQPHRYSRTQLLAEEFSHSLEQADEAWVLPVYAASEAPLPGVSSELITRGLSRKTGSGPLDTENDWDRFLSHLKPGDLVLTLGAGDVWKLGPKILESVKNDITKVS
jgi:UDP-N-acetylmuramate--alanine ligase